MPLVLCVILAGCESAEEAAPALLPSAGVAADICAVTRGDVSVPKLYEGYVAAYAEELSLSVGGTIKKINVLPGQYVNAGDVLIELDLDAEREKVESLEEKLSYTRSKNELIIKQLELKAAICQTELSEIKSAGADSKTLALKQLELEEKLLALKQQKETIALEEESLENELANAKAVLTPDSLIAPFDGCVAREISLKPGDRFVAYQTLLVLADDTRLRVTTEFISESTVAASSIRVLIGANEYEVSYVPMDRIEYVSLSLSGVTVYSDFEFVGSVPEVEAGMYAALIFENNLTEDALLIPANAALQDSGGKYVYVYTEDGGKEKRYVKLRTISGAIYSIVLEGLSEGELIYVTDK